MIGGLNKDALSLATTARDKRFDGIFYFAITSTGLYCRPSCSAPRPAGVHFSFFSTIEKAKAHDYRPCKFCHPDRLKNDLSKQILSNIDAGVISDKGVHGLADSLHISERQLRRIVKARTGDSPVQLNQTKRLSAARQLTLQTRLPIINVAFNTGFSSLRQFNDAFKDAFKISPSKMRKNASLVKQPNHSATLPLRTLTNQINRVEYEEN